MRRGVGISGINQQLLEKAKFNEKGSELARDHLDKLAKQFEIFRDNLESFAEKHKSEIKKDVAFRRQFQEMCATVGDGLIPLPSEYQSAIDKRQKSISLLANEITAAQLNPEQRQRFQRFVVSNFEAWLDATGNAKILNHLSSLQQQ
ncbi:unnamed protein product [Rotaria sp. Silwood2]|nr:unnamed protein product [Rotaria sp. Silwood2]